MEPGGCFHKTLMFIWPQLHVAVAMLGRGLERRADVTALGTCFRRPGITPRLLMVDVDLFKSTNDTYGHQVVGAVLCGIADALCALVRKGDLVCRLGGEEFVAICVGADDASALREPR